MLYYREEEEEKQKMEMHCPEVLYAIFCTCTSRHRGENTSQTKKKLGANTDRKRQHMAMVKRQKRI